MVGLCLWKLAGMTGRKTMRLTTTTTDFWGMSRFSKSRGLCELEEAGLVRVARSPGMMPVVTILPV